MFTLDQVVPWGRSFEEYRRMFALTDADLESRILGCADGPASFNTEATRRGTGVVSFDPLYRYDVSQIRERIAATCDQVLEQTRQNAGEFVWDTIASVEQLGTVRMAAMQAFLDDYEAGRQQGRYVDAELPTLPFPDRVLRPRRLLALSVSVHEPAHRSVSPGGRDRIVPGGSRSSDLPAAGAGWPAVAVRRTCRGFQSAPRG